MKLAWDETGKRYYETGVKMGVLYNKGADGTYTKGVAWNGLITITESPSGAENTSIYADDIEYLSLTSAEKCGLTIEAFTYPDEFGECDGSAEVAEGVFIAQQTRKGFGLCYRTVLGNDTEYNDYGYKLHLVYGCKAAPSEKAHNTINESPDTITFSWEVSTTPIPVAGRKPSALITIDSTKVNAAKLKALEDILYGTEANEPRLPLPDEVITLLSVAAQG